MRAKTATEKMAEKILIAVDFGTTYSAISYTKLVAGAQLRDATLTVVDVGWPGQGHTRSPKIPTVFKVEGNGFRYGFEVQDDPERVAFPKLFLDPTQLTKALSLTRFTSTQTISNSETAIQKLMDGVTKYFSALKDRAFWHMVTYSKWDQADIDSTSHEYIMTVPAIWSDCARDRTLRCALNAGLGVRGNMESIKLVTEPEAAAMFTISELPNASINEGEIILVCDAGGGTVDLATYQIAKLQPLDLEEITISSGDLCGSVLLNTQFLDLVGSKLDGHKLSPKIRHQLEKDFNEDIKPRFSGDDSEDTRLFVPAEDSFKGATVTVSAAEMKVLFETVMMMVITLLEKALEEIRRKEPEKQVTILLVGGFGGSDYLTQKVEEAFADLEVHCPPDAWSAVVRGALLRGLVSKRKIRAAYGVVFMEKWSRQKHERGELAEFAAANKIWDRYEEKWMCTNRMKWYVKKGRQFSDVASVSFPFYRAIGVFHPLKFEDEVYVYHEGHDGDEGPPLKDIDCRLHASLKSDLSKIPGIRDRLERLTTSKGEHYYKIHYNLEMCFDAMLRFRIRFEGNIVGEAQIDYVDRSSELVRDNR